MKKIGFYSLVCLFLIGCGGGGTTTSSSVPSPAATFDGLLAKDLNLTKDINDGELVIDNNDSIKDQYLTVINYLRSLKIKCNDSHAEEGPSSVVEWNQLLAYAAKEHSEDYNSSGIYNRDHSGSGTVSDITANGSGIGSTPAKRVEHQGYIGSSGENQARYVSYYKTGSKPSNFIAIYDNTWLSVMEGWMKSKSGHCSNIMNPLFEDFGMHEAGIYVEDNGTHTLHSTYWTQEFGKAN